MVSFDPFVAIVCGDTAHIKKIFMNDVYEGLSCGQWLNVEGVIIIRSGWRLSNVLTLLCKMGFRI